jgi:hypothetical protein
VSWIGLGVALFVDLMRSLPMQRGLDLGIMMLLAFSFAVPLVCLLLMPRAASALVGSADILIPLALVVIAGKVIGWLTVAPLFGSLLSPSLPLHWLSLSFRLSLSFVINVALAVAYAAWMTAVIVEFVRSGSIDPRSLFKPAMKRFWQFFGVLFIGWVTVMIVAPVFLALMPVVAPLALFGMLVFALAWNFSTAAVLPAAWQDDDGFWNAFRRGMNVSRANLRKWWPVLLAQMLLLGLATYYFTGSAMRRSSGWTVNAFWIGGFADDSRWYAAWAAAMNAPKLPFVETVLTLLLGVFAVIVKIAIVQRLQPETVTET